VRPLPPVPGPRGSRRATDLFIGAWLVVQVALPLAYYLGLRAPTDERFAWRMFSAVRLDRCDVVATETVRDGASTTARRLPLRETLPVGWIVELGRNQPRVVDRFLQRACDEGGRLGVTLVRRCRAIDGSEAPPEEVARPCRASP
jgi:hypothetical protein